MRFGLRDGSWVTFGVCYMEEDRTGVRAGHVRTVIQDLLRSPGPLAEAQNDDDRPAGAGRCTGVMPAHDTHAGGTHCVPNLLQTLPLGTTTGRERRATSNTAIQNEFDDDLAPGCATRAAALRSSATVFLALSREMFNRRRIFLGRQLTSGSLLLLMGRSKD